MKYIFISDNNLFQNAKKYHSKFKNTKLIFSPIYNISYSNVVFNSENLKFYADVTENRIQDIIIDNADDLLIQSSSLHDVSFQAEKYADETKKLINKVLDTLETRHYQTIEDFENLLKETNIITQKQKDRLRLVLINTTIGPRISELLFALSEKKVKDIFTNYLKKAKNRL